MTSEEPILLLRSPNSATPDDDALFLTTPPPPKMTESEIQALVSQITHFDVVCGTQEFQTVFLYTSSPFVLC